MSKRPILSLSRKAPSIVSTNIATSEPQKEKLKFDPVAFEKEAIKKRIKRYRSALDILKSLNLPMPLSKGIRQSVKLQLKEYGISHKAFSWAMQKWTHSDAYLNAVIHSRCRFNLDGSEAELITDEEREYSRDLLDKSKQR